jgi:ligand-binding sensor domain-containing protein
LSRTLHHILTGKTQRFMTKSRLHLNLALPFLFVILISSCTGQEASMISNHLNLVDQLEDHIEKPNSEDIPVSQIGDNIPEIFEDSQGNLWFGTTDQGVARYNGTDLRYFDPEDGLCGKTLADMAEDKDGRLWFGTYGDMCIYDSNNSPNSSEISFISFEKNGEVPILGWGWKSVQADKNGEIWVNTHHGIFQYQAPDFVPLEVPTPPEGNQSFCNTPGLISLDLIDRHGNKWFGTDGDGAYKYDGATFIHFTQKDGLPSNNVSGIVEDKHGNIWFGCIRSADFTEHVGGLCRYDGKDFTTFKKIKGLYKNNIQTIYADKSGDVWVGATGVGVYQFNGDDCTLYKEPQGLDHTLGSNITGLQSMLEDSQGRKWLGFHGGLYRLDGSTFTNITVNGPWK